MLQSLMRHPRQLLHQGRPCHVQGLVVCYKYLACLIVLLKVTAGSIVKPSSVYLSITSLSMQQNLVQQAQHV